MTTTPCEPVDYTGAGCEPSTTIMTGASVPTTTTTTTTTTVRRPDDLARTGTGLDALVTWALVLLIIGITLAAAANLRRTKARQIVP